MLVAVLAACHRPAPEADRGREAADTDTDAETGETGVDTVPATVTASCAVQPDNALRVDCAVHVDPPAAVTLTLSSAEGPPRTVDGDDVVADHVLTAWRMLEDTDYQWTASAVGAVGSASGTVRTGVLPEEVSLAVSVTGAPTRTEDVLVMVGCGSQPAVVALDPSGRVVWYQVLAAGLPDGFHPITALAFTEDRRLGIVVDQTLLRLFALDGSVVLDAEMGVPEGYDRYLHHDMVTRDGYLYVLNAYLMDVDGTDYVTDGIYVMDGSTGEVLAAWDLASYLTPTGNPDDTRFWDWAWGPDATDWAHANGLHVDDEGEITLSLFEASTILRIAGDPLDPEFGTVRWALVGDPASPFVPTMTIDGGGVTTDTSFGHQHGPTVLPGGDLMFLDNTLAGPESRVLRLTTDMALGRATVTEAISLGTWCPIEGTARPLANGNIVAQCARLHAFMELDPVEDAVVATTATSCTGEALPGVQGPIAIPVSL